MDNKVKVIVILGFLVLIGGMAFDISHRMDKMENKKAEMQTGQQQEQTQEPAETEQSAADVYQVHNGNTSEATFNAMAQNAKLQQQTNKSETSANSNEEEEISELSQKAPDNKKFDYSSITFFLNYPELNISQNLKTVPANYNAVDKQKNRYIFIPIANDINTPGMIIKLSPAKKVLWQKEIKAVSAKNINIKGLKYNASSLNVEFTAGTNTAYTLILSEEGNLITNPLPMRLKAESSFPSSKLKLEMISHFTFKDGEYSIISSIYMVPIDNYGGLRQHFLLYKSDGKKLVKKAMIYQQRINQRELNNLKNPEFIVQKEADSILILVKASSGTSQKDIYTPVKIMYSSITSNIPFVSGSGPQEISDGITIQNAIYKSDLSY